MSSVPPADNWDALLSSFEGLSASEPASSPPTASLTVSTSTSSTSGEFQPFVFLGSSLAEGGGSKKTFFLTDVIDQEITCLGMVGGTKFCLKHRTGVGCCDTLSHVKSRFSPEDATLYLKENEIRAWCSPSFAVGMLTRDQIQFMLHHRLSKDDWISTFEALKVGAVPDWIQQSGEAKLWLKPAEASNQGEAEELILLSPKLTVTNDVLFSGIPMLSFDDMSQEDDHPVLSLEQVIEVGKSLFRGGS